MTKRSRPTAAVWILRVEDQPNGPMITVVSRSELVAPGLETATRYQNVSSAVSAIADSATQFVKKCARQPEY